MVRIRMTTPSSIGDPGDIAKVRLKPVFETAESIYVMPHSVRSPSVPALRSMDEFRAYAQTVGTERYAKFLIDIRTDEIYYMDANRFAVHADFVLAELTPSWEPRWAPLRPAAALVRRWRVRNRLREYNLNYEAEKPEFLLGTVVHHTDQDVFTLALWEGDRARPEDVRRIYQKVAGSFFVGRELLFRPNSTEQERLLEAPELEGIPTITNDRIYRDAPYHAFTAGASVGRLRIVRGAGPADLRFARDEIVVLTEIVPDITPIRGLITEHFCTPLSHVALRARAWGIPHAGIKDAGSLYAALDGELVFFEAGVSGPVLRAATVEEERREEERRAGRGAVEVPAPDFSVRSLKRLPEIRASEARAYGAKAANLGEIAHAGCEGFVVPGGFGIPVVHYAEHLERGGLREQIREILEDPRCREDAAHRERRLADLRDAIRAQPMDPTLVHEIEARLRETTGSERAVFVRSSTNAEDLPGLNGAGLYDSVPNVRGAQAVADAVKQVWASVWNLRAFDERVHFGVDHEAVYGAVLVLEGVNATAAGVLITANVFDGSQSPAYTINAKSGLGIGVVEGTDVPEQILFDPTEDLIKVVTRSDEDTILVFDEESGGVKEVPKENRGAPVLEDDQVRCLARGAEAVAQLFPDDGPLDIEWLFEGEELRIVQSRPYLGA